MHAALIASLAAIAVAAPAKRQAATPPEGVTDATILQYALTLEHLENAFYREALAKFSEADFKQAGLPSSFLNNLKEIKFDEQTHVDYLTAGLTAAGATPVAECSYAFGFEDVKTFLAIANVLEGVGVDAYLGAAQYVKSPAYLTAAGSILTVESRHSAYIRGSQTPALSPFPAPFDTALGFNQVFSLAAPFITGCPAGPTSSLEVLKGFKAFPALACTPAGIATAGEKLTCTVAKPIGEPEAAWFVTSGGYSSAKFTKVGDAYEVIVPEIGVPNLQPGTVGAGQSYLIFTKDDKAPTDDNTVAGPAVIEIADNAYGRAPDEYDCTSGGSKPSPPAYTPKSPEQPKGKPAPPPSTPKSPEQPKPKPAPPAKTPKSPEQPKPTYEAPKPTYSKEHKPSATSTCTEEHAAPTYPAKYD